MTKPSDSKVPATTTHAPSPADTVKDGAKQLLEQGQEKAAQAREAIVEAKDTVVSTASGLIANVGKAISARPFLSVGVAFGIGYLAMRITRR